MSFSVVEGRVLLTGVIASPEARARPIELAGRAGGVREVIDELQMRQVPGVAAGARDAWTAAQLALRLMLDLNVAHINYINGTVTISTGR